MIPLLIILQQSSQYSKLDSTVETLRTVLTQKIMSEAQTVSTEVHDRIDNNHINEISIYKLLIFVDIA